MSNSAKCLGEPLRQWSGSRRPTGQNGLTLVETLIAAAALLIVSLAVVPLFSRALLNNRSGYDSNEASYLVRSELEADLPVEISHSRFDFRNPDPDQSVQASSLGTGGEELLFTDLYWDHGALSPGAPTATPKPLCNIVVGGTPKTLTGSTDCVKLGDAGWITSPNDSKGLVLWQRRKVLRQYTFADISTGVIAQSGLQLVTLGHAHFFDRPLLTTDPPSSGHFKEHTIELKSRRADPTLTPPQLQETTLQLGAGSQRTRVFRTF